MSAGRHAGAGKIWGSVFVGGIVNLIYYSLIVTLPDDATLRN